MASPRVGPARYSVWFLKPLWLFGRPNEVLRALPRSPRDRSSTETNKFSPLPVMKNEIFWFNGGGFSTRLSLLLRAAREEGQEDVLMCPFHWDRRFIQGGIRAYAVTSVPFIPRPRGSQAHTQIPNAYQLKHFNPLTYTRSAEWTQHA